MAELAPEPTAARVALWRALHVELDPAPHVLEDTLGLRLLAPSLDEGWRARGDMHPQGTATFRASIVARARFVEDLVVASGAPQYVILGAGLDTFAQRRPELAVRVFEIDRPEPQAWKRARLEELGMPVPELVPVDFESGAPWWDALVARGFDAKRPAVVASTGVTPYLTREATLATLRTLTGLAPGSSVVVSFLLPADRLEGEDRRAFEFAERGARASGTPFIGLYAPEDFVALAREAGFRDVHHVTMDEMASRFSIRQSPGEQLIVARI